jgi:hypothetical protein
MWERAQATASREVRALLVLSAAHPEETLDSLSRLSIGRRDRCLLELHQRLVGRTFELSSECPQCDQAIELALDTYELALTMSDIDVTNDSPGRLHRLSHEDTVIDFRLPTTADLDAVSLCADVESGKRQLIGRCVQAASLGDGCPLLIDELSPEAQDALEREMDRLDPLAVTRLDLRCPGCGHGWWARLDISEIVLFNLSAQARILLREVAALAGHYHWSEGSILAMSAGRRRSYLELAGR